MLATQIDQIKQKQTPKQIAVTISVGHSYFGVYALGRAWVASKFSPTWFLKNPITTWDCRKLPKSTKMKKISILFVILTASLFSCSKSSDPVTTPPTPVTTSLEITLKDELGNPVIGASVKLYNSESNYQNATNQLQTTKTSGSNGVVLFDNLSAIKYYFSADKDCLTNAFGGVATDNLYANSKNNVTCILSPSGTLVINNTSTNPYDVYINDVLQIPNMTGGTSQSFKAGKGTYKIRVIQKSGYLLTPTDKTYTGSISCGTILTCTFP